MTDEDESRRAIATWQRATAEGDAVTILPLTADAAVFLAPGRPPMRGKAAFAAGLAALRDFRIEARGDIQEIVVRGDVAWCWTAPTVVVTPRVGGPAITRSGPVLSVFGKAPALAWVPVRDANMLDLVPS